MRILIVPGDGIGPEIAAATLLAVKALAKKFGLPLELEHAECALASMQRYGTTLRDEDIERARRADGVVLGPMSIRGIRRATRAAYTCRPFSAGSSTSTRISGPGS